MCGILNITLQLIAFFRKQLFSVSHFFDWICLAFLHTIEIHSKTIVMRKFKRESTHKSIFSISFRHKISLFTAPICFSINTRAQ